MSPLEEEFTNRTLGRRRLLRRAGTAVAGVAGATAVGGVLASPAQADPGQSVIIGSANTGGATTTGLANSSIDNPALALSNSATVDAGGIDAAGAPLLLTPNGDFVAGPVGALGASLDGTLWSSVPGWGGPVSDFVRTGGNSTYVKTFSPVRVLDTRTSQAAGKAAMVNGDDPSVRNQSTGQVLTGAVLNISLDSLLVFGWSLFINVTVLGGNAGGFVTVFPGSEPRPHASNVNFDANKVVANFAVVALGSFGNPGDGDYVMNGLSLYAYKATQIIVDVSGAVVNYEEDVLASAGLGAAAVATPKRQRPAHLIGRKS